MDVDKLINCKQLFMINTKTNEDIEIYFYFFALNMEQSKIKQAFPFVRLLSTKNQIRPLLSDFAYPFFNSPLSVRRYKLEIFLPYSAYAKGTFIYSISNCQI